MLGIRRVFQSTIGRNVRYFSTSLPDHVKLELPALSPTMTEGVIANWVKKEGDLVEAGQSVCEIETDKATVDFEVQDDGYLAKILVQAGGAPKPCGSVIGIVVENKEDIPAFANVTFEEFSNGSSNQAAAAPAPKPQQKVTETIQPSQESLSMPPKPVQSSGSRVFISPLAKVIATDKGLDITKISGSGPNGRIIKVDVENYTPVAEVVIEGIATTAIPSDQGVQYANVGSGYIDYPVTNGIREIAAQLQHSKTTVPHYYVSTEIDISDLLTLRTKLNTSLGEEEQLSVNDFVVKAAALSMKHVPQVNSSWGETFIRQYKDCDINIAILDESGEGVLMPVIKSANNKGLSDISKTSREIMKTSTQELDLSVGTFTISNMGAFGLKSFTPIVREPQASSLGVGTITKKVIPSQGVDENGNPNYKIISSMTVTLSSDHRVLDGASAATWLQEFKSLLQDPLKMLL